MQPDEQAQPVQSARKGGQVLAAVADPVTGVTLPAPVLVVVDAVYHKIADAGAMYVGTYASADLQKAGYGTVGELQRMVLTEDENALISDVFDQILQSRLA